MRLTKEQVAHYEDHGFLVLPELFSEEEIAVIRAEVPGLYAEDTPRRILEKSGAVRSIFAPHLTNPIFRCLATLPRMVETAQDLLKGDVYIHQYKLNAKVALEGDQWEWHQDFLYWNKEDGMPASRVLTSAVFLDDVGDFNGPMLVIPGSHQEGMIDVDPDARFTPTGSASGDGAVAAHASDPAWMPTLTADLKYKINKEILRRILKERSIHSVKGRMGLALFFHGNLFHASANNLSPYDRTTVFVSYNSVANGLGSVPNPRPPFIANRDFRPVEPSSDDALLAMGSRWGSAVRVPEVQ